MVKNFKKGENLSEEGDSPTRNKGQHFRTQVPNLQMGQIDNSYGFHKTDRDKSMPNLKNQANVVSQSMDGPINNQSATQLSQI